MNAASFSSDADRWAAVGRRDRSADGVFYYSVRTTGVYCRPSCASRPALRKNVRFHTSCEEAEQAGFRACKRCGRMRRAWPSNTREASRRPAG